MKYKFPKKILLGSTEFDIKYDKESSNGSFIYPSGKDRGLITIGTRDIKASGPDFLIIVIHELSEILHIEMYQRFDHKDNRSNYLFSFSHKEFAIHASLLAAALMNFIQ